MKGFLAILATVFACVWQVTVAPLFPVGGLTFDFVLLMLVVIAAMLITGRLFESNLVILLPAYFFIAAELQRKNFSTWRQVALPVASVVLIDLHRVIWTLANPDKQALPWFLLIFPFLGVILVWLIFARKRLQEIRALKGDSSRKTMELAYSAGTAIPRDPRANIEERID